MKEVWCIKCQVAFKYKDLHIENPRDLFCMLCGQTDVLIGRKDKVIKHFMDEKTDSDD